MKITKDEMEGLSENFYSEIQNGLKKNGTSSLAMLNSFVKRPTGKEKGDFIALDLGGSKFRVETVSLKGDGKIPSPVIKRFHITKKLMQGTVNSLYDFLTEKILETIDHKKEYKLGFTFAFPVNQTAINKGALKKWTKKFHIPGLLKSDVVQPLKEALERKKCPNIKVVALANDTVGTWATESYKDKNTSMGIILGTGTNAAVLINDNVVNMEWGNFDKFVVNNNDLRTPYDIQIDETHDKGSQILEKMVSGKYLGEIFRLVLVDLMTNRTFASQDYNLLKNEDFAFNKKDGISSHDLFIITQQRGSIDKIAHHLDIIGLKNLEREEINVIKKTAMVIIERSARIVAAVIAGTLKYIDPNMENKHTIAIDGSVYTENKLYQNTLHNNLQKMLGKAKMDSKIKLTITKDGSGIGAAVIAAVAEQQQEQNNLKEEVSCPCRKFFNTF